VPFTSQSESVVDVFGDHSLSGGIKCNHYPLAQQATQLTNIQLPAHLSSTLWLGAEQVPGGDIEWVNRSFWEMRSRGRWLAQQGLDTAAIMGDTCPIISPLHSTPNREDDARFWTVSRWAARFVDNFLHLSHSDRLACWVVIFVSFQVRSLLKWQVADQSVLTKLSGTYVPMLRRTARSQTGIDPFQYRSLSHIWRAWIF
jgi:hypothetical protein